MIDLFMKQLICALATLISSAVCAQPSLSSPDGNIRLTIKPGSLLSYSVYFKNKPVVLPSSIQLTLLSTSSTISDGRIKKMTRRSVKSSIISPVPEKRKIIPDEYNELTIHFTKPVKLIFRVYNDGVAYRFVSSYKDSIIVKDETAHFT